MPLRGTPSPKSTALKLPSSLSGTSAWNYTDKELTAIEQQGREALVADIPQLRIIEQSRTSAARIIIPLCTALGFDEKDVTITFRKQDYTVDEIKQLMQNENR